MTDEYEGLSWSFAQACRKADAARAKNQNKPGLRDLTHEIEAEAEQLPEYSEDIVERLGKLRNEYSRTNK
jgi:hypothetical protein